MKKLNHKEWHLDEIKSEQISIPVVDTSVTSSLYKNAPEFTPNYTGDMPDMSRKSLMEIKQMSKDVATEIKSKKEYLETFKNAPTKEKNVKLEKEE